MLTNTSLKRFCICRGCRLPCAVDDVSADRLCPTCRTESDERRPPAKEPEREPEREPEHAPEQRTTNPFARCAVFPLDPLVLVGGRP